MHAMGPKDANASKNAWVKYKKQSIERSCLPLPRGIYSTPHNAIIVALNGFINLFVEFLPIIFEQKT